MPVIANGRCRNLSGLLICVGHIGYSLQQPRTPSWNDYFCIGCTGYSYRQIAQLTVEFKFSRLIGYHIVQTFVPSFLVVSLTWFSFWIGLDAIPGRCTLLVTSMLSLITLFTGIKNDLPAVAYIKVRLRPNMYSILPQVMNT